MALVNGTNFDHIDLQAVPGGNTTRHMLQDTQARDDISDIKNALSDKADIDGYYEGMTVGDAEQLVATVGIEDKVPYLFRTSGGSADIGDREVDKIVGGTVAWNQLVNTDSETVTVASGHKYFASLSGAESIGTSDGTALSVTGGTDNVIDLTQMFGATIADYINTLETATPGAGVAWFRALFPKDYYAYDAGSLQSVQVSAHKLVGFNQWDEEWEAGEYNSSGAKTSNIENTWRAKNFIPCLPGTVYYFAVLSETVSGGCVCFYDSDKHLISRTQSTIPNGAFTTPSDCRFITFYCIDEAGRSNVCINLHWDGERDGEFEAYKAHIYPLDSNLVLRGVPKLDANNKLYYDGDEYASDGKVTRKYGIVDLGTQDYSLWNSSSSRDVFAFSVASAENLNIKSPSSLNERINAVCVKFTKAAYNETWVEGMMAYTNSQNKIGFVVAHGAYSSWTDFKAAMSGIYLVYELEEPTTETADPFQNPQIVDDFGTEQYIDAGNRDVEIPVGHDTFYRQNLRAKLEMAPNSPDSNGDYLVRHNNGQNSYVAYASPLPAMPAEDGTYTLKCTVSDGTVELSWENAT